MFFLARDLKCTVKELGQRMDSQEFSEWIAFNRWFGAMPDSWRETALLVAAILAPHCEKGKKPKVEDFVPLERPPQHQSQDLSALLELRRAFGLDD